MSAEKVYVTLPRERMPRLEPELIPSGLNSLG
jgi:hypothetical protein